MLGTQTGVASAAPIIRPVPLGAIGIGKIVGNGVKAEDAPLLQLAAIFAGARAGVGGAVPTCGMRIVGDVDLGHNGFPLFRRT